jgi:hypothetical protein
MSVRIRERLGYLTKIIGKFTKPLAARKSAGAPSRRILAYPRRPAHCELLTQPALARFTAFHSNIRFHRSDLAMAYRNDGNTMGAIGGGGQTDVGRVLSDHRRSR